MWKSLTVPKATTAWRTFTISDGGASTTGRYVTYSFRAAPPRTTTYYFAFGTAYSPRTTIKVRPAVSLAAEPPAATAGQPVVLGGAVLPLSTAGSQVTLQELVVAGPAPTWVAVGEATIADDGSYAFEWPAVEGTHTFRAFLPAGDQLLAAVEPCGDGDGGAGALTRALRSRRLPDGPARRLSSGSASGARPRTPSKCGHTSRNASTTLGSNCAPALRRSSSSASSSGIALRYGRSEVMAWKASQTNRMRAGRGIVVAGEAVGVAAAVPALVRGADRLADRREIVDRRDDALADDRVLRHHGELLVGELVGLVEDVPGDPDLADVVEDARVLQVAQLGLVEAESCGRPTTAIMASMSACSAV